MMAQIEIGAGKASRPGLSCACGDRGELVGSDDARRRCAVIAWKRRTRTLRGGR